MFCVLQISGDIPITVLCFTDIKWYPHHCFVFYRYQVISPSLFCVLQISGDIPITVLCFTDIKWYPHHCFVFYRYQVISPLLFCVLQISGDIPITVGEKDQVFFTVSRHGILVQNKRSKVITYFKDVKYKKDIQLCHTRVLKPPPSPSKMQKNWQNLKICLLQNHRTIFN